MWGAGLPSLCNDQVRGGKGLSSNIKLLFSSFGICTVVLLDAFFVGSQSIHLSITLILKILKIQDN